MEEENELALSLDSILDGTHTFGDNEDEFNEDDEYEDADDIEDTDAYSEEDEDEDTNDQDADSDDDTLGESENENGEENAQENENGSDDDNSNDDKTANGAEEESNDESGKEIKEEDETDDVKSKDESDDNTPVVDYKAFFETLTSAEFKANGKIVKGFTDPAKIIRAQQMLYGFEEKMAGFKQYRPLIGSLKKSGFVDNPDKFNMMMDIMNGDKEALKQFVKNSNIDPVVDLDLDSISYSGKNYIDSKESMDVEDTLEIAKNLGIEDKFRNTVGKQWDNESFNEFTSKPKVREDLLTHMSTRLNADDENSITVYDAVQERISEMKVLDTQGTFNSKSSIAQYREAVLVLSAERKAEFEANKVKNDKVVAKTEKDAKEIVSKNEIEAEKAKIIAKRTEEELKTKVDAKEKQVAEQRKKASSASTRKPKTVNKEPPFDPLKLSGQEFRDMFDNIGRK